MRYNHKKEVTQRGATYNIFISYSTLDIEIAKRIAAYLPQIQGVSVFLSDSNLIVGMLGNVLIEKIKNCDLFLVLYSKNSHSSNYVQQEIGVAKGDNKVIIPILLDAEARPSAMLQGTSYQSIYDENKAKEQMQRLYNYIVQESQKKVNGQKKIGKVIPKDPPWLGEVKRYWTA